MNRIEQDTTARFRAAVITGAPLAMLASYLYHPFIAVLTNSDSVAHAVMADTLRWGFSHATVAVASCLMIVAFIAVRAFFHDAGEDRYSARALPWVAFGGAMYAVLPGIEIGAMAGLQAGADLARMSQMLDLWFVPILMTGALANLVGLILFARAFRTGGVLGASQTRLVVTALVVMALARFVPLGVVQFHVQGVAGLLALWPVAQAIRSGVRGPVVEHARPAAAM